MIFYHEDVTFLREDLILLTGGLMFPFYGVFLHL